MSEPDILDDGLKFFATNVLGAEPRAYIALSVFGCHDHIIYKETLTNRYGEPKPIGEGRQVNTI